MKLLLTLLTTVLFSQISFATGGAGEDPNGAFVQTNQAGSTFTSAVAESNQPKICKVCEENKKAMMSNQVGVLNTSSGSVSGSGTTGQPVKTGQ